MAILFARYKDVQALGFLDKALGVTHRYVGWAEVEKIRWGLPHQYPWLEVAYATAYRKILNPMVPGEFVAAMPPAPAMVTNHHGRMGTRCDPKDVKPGIDLLQEFLSTIHVTPQLSPIPPAPDPAESDEWVKLERNSPNELETYEHAEWILSDDLAELLGEDLHHSAIREADLRYCPQRNSTKPFLQEMINTSLLSMRQEGLRFAESRCNS